MNWTQRTPPTSERYIQVSDSYEMYYALLPKPLTATDAIRDFVSTYQFNRDEPREELEESLREDLSWQVHEGELA